MNAQLINPTSVLGLVAASDAVGPKPGPWRAPAWARHARARLDVQLRYRRTLHALRRLNDRQLEDADLAGADFAALAWRCANGSEPLSGPRPAS
jgi:uncharacterized protein YjiS (DUF1127 family)